MVVSTLFVTSSSCMLFGAAMWLGSYGLFSIILDSTEEFNASVVISMLLFFNNFFPYGMRLMKNVDSELYYRRTWMLIYTEIGNIILLLLLLFVADVVRPGCYMKRWHFNYLFIPSCYRRLRSSIKSQSHKRRTTLGASRPSWYNFECGPVSGQEILYVENLTTYKNRIRNIPQLKNISIHFYKNEISIILGPHGSGKTQLISMLAGWRKPQVGSIYFYEDYDIYENWWHYRSIMDVVMPKNALYDLLSVNETIRYFCEVKEMEKSVHSQETANKSEILKWLNILEPHIVDANVLVQNLSYSQQRLVSLCCSLACNREIILLDEPTSLMTLAEQIYYWEILRQEKQNRSIILATSSIDEADAIGDRIAIFSEGSLLVWGTPFFLKARFGTGFNLVNTIQIF